MKKYYNAAVFGSISMLVSGCQSANMRPGEHVKLEDLSDAGIVVVGMNSPLPSRWGKWAYSDGKVNAIVGRAFFSTTNVSPPSNGFIVMKVGSTSPGMRFGPSVFSYVGNKYFKYCSGMRLPSLEVKAGEVIYGGNINANMKGESLFLNYDYDFDAARKFIAQYYPDLSSKLQEKRFSLYRIGSLPNCY